MSDKVFALVVTLSLFVSALLWVPFLHLCRRCHRRVFRRTLPGLGMGLLLAVHGAAFGQLTALNSITTVAGNGTAGFSGDGGQATAAALYNPFGVTFDKAGNLYFSDTGNNTVRKVTPNGIITTVAGNGNYGFSGDNGPATSAMLNAPAGLAIDGSGNLYIADLVNRRIRKVTPGGTITTIAGNGTLADTGNGGPAANASLSPNQLAFDASGNLYVASIAVVRKISPAGIITAFAGTGTTSFSGDGGLATSATFSSVEGVAVDTAGNVYISSTTDNRVREVTIADGKINTVVGNGTNSSGDGGPATSAGIRPFNMAFDPSGNLFLTDRGNQTVREVFASNKKIATVAGNGTSGFSGDGNIATNAEFASIFGIAIDNSGNLYVADYFNNRIRAVGPLFIPPTAVASTAARQYYYLQTTANETITSFTAPASLGNKQEYTIGAVTGCVVDGKTANAAGSICAVPITFSPAYPGQRPIPLQAVTSTGNINFPMNGLASAPLAALTPGIGTTVAGTGISGNTGDSGQATSAKIGSPFLATDGMGNIYFADSSFQVVRRIDALTGVITKVAGTGVMGYSGDGGPALQATFGDVQAVTVDASGNLYIADSVDCVVRKITTATGIITTVAGNGTVGHSGIGGLAVNAQLCPNSLTVDAAGNLYIVDGGNYGGTAGDWVLKVTASTGILSLVAGTGVSGYTGDGGQATAAQLNFPEGVALDSANNVYISDGHNNVIRKVNAITGIITTLAGNGTYGFLGDGGPATSAEIEFPRPITVDSAGDIYFGDCCTYTVRKIDAATGIIRTVAGGGTSSTDGVPATTQGYSYVNAVALDGAGNLYIGDFDARIHKVNVATTTLTFATTTSIGSLDTTDDPQTAILSNIGNAPLNGFSGNGAITASWLIDATSTCFPFSPVASGASCTLPVDFKPTVAGSPVSGTLTLLDTSLNAQPATQTITLTGTATGAGSLSISPTSLTFGPTAQGSTSAAQTATITNTTSQAVYLSSGSLTDSTDYTQSDNCNGLIAATTGSCTVTFTFTPKSAGGLNSTYAIHDLNNPNSPLNVSLAGIATGPPATLTVTPNPVAFPNTTVNTTSASIVVTLKNTGGSGLHLQTTIATLGGADATAFSLTGSACGYTLAPNASCALTLAFSPTTARTYNATLNIPSSDPNSPAIVPVTGTGVAASAPQAALTPSAVNFGNVTTGSSSTAQTFTLSNAGNASLPITSIALVGANAASFTITSNGCGSSLSAGSTCSILVNFTPSAVATQTASLTVIDSVGTQTSGLSGTGIVPLIPPDFTLVPTPATQSSYLGTTVTYQLAIAPVASNNPYTTAINLTASGLPKGATASFAPASVTPGTATVSSVLTITIPALQGSNREAPPYGRSSTPAIFSATLLLALLLTGNKRLRRRVSLTRMALLLLLLGGLSAAITGCAPGTGFAVPQSTSTITITGTSGTLVHSATVTLTLK